MKKDYKAFGQVEPAKKLVTPMTEEVNKMGRELNADIVKEMKERGETLTPAMRKLYNKERIKALGLTLIQGGKED